MDNPDTHATLGTQDTGRRQTKHQVHKTQDEYKHNTKRQHRKLKRLVTRTPPKIGDEPMPYLL